MTAIVDVTFKDIAGARHYRDGTGNRSEHRDALGCPLNRAVRRLLGYEGAVFGRDGRVVAPSGRVLAYAPLDAMVAHARWHGGGEIEPLRFPLGRFLEPDLGPVGAVR